MKVIVAGGSGWLGRALSSSLASDGHQVIVLSRQIRPGAATRRWDGRILGPWADEIDGANAIVNLSGESIGARRWGPPRKRVLLESRTQPTHALVAAIERAAHCPAVLVNQSAVGYYGDRGDEAISEADPPGADFLAQLVVQWETEARAAEALGVRVVLTRTGVVIGPGGGALAQMALPFRRFIGGPIGSGRQWFPWVHIDDVVGLLRWAIERPEASGPINVVAPEPVTLKTFADTLGRVLHRPSWLPVPRLPLRIALGEIADALMVSQRVVPQAAQRLGYRFHEPTLLSALQRALG